MNDGKRLLKNTAIIALGNISTRLIAFLMLPVYTAYLTPNEYGVYDYVFTIALFITPLITLLLEESMFRFLIDAKLKQDKLNVITNVFVIIICSVCVCSLIYFFISKIYDIYLCLASFLFVLCIPFTTMVSAIFRGTGNFKFYTFLNMIDSLLVTAFSLGTVLVGICNVENLLFASAIGRFLGLMIVVIFTKLWSFLDFSLIELKIMKSMVLFSLPLIPNRIIPLGILLFNRTMILYFLGTSESGMYAISCKISLIIVTLYGFFSVSWQETAARVVSRDDVSSFYSEILDKTSKIMWVTIINFIAFSPVIFFLLIDSRFYSSLFYVPLLLIGTYLNCLALFLGGVLIAYKDSKSIGITVFKYFMLHMLISVISIRFIGVYSVIISDIIANFMFVFFRINVIKKYVHISLLSGKDICIGIIAMLVVLGLFFTQNLIANIINCSFAMIYGIWIVHNIGFDKKYLF